MCDNDNNKNNDDGSSFIWRVIGDLNTINDIGLKTQQISKEAQIETETAINKLTQTNDSGDPGTNEPNDLKETQYSDSDSDADDTNTGQNNYIKHNGDQTQTQMQYTYRFDRVYPGLAW